MLKLTAVVRRGTAALLVLVLSVLVLVHNSSTLRGRLWTKNPGIPGDNDRATGCAVDEQRQHSLWPGLDHGGGGNGNDKSNSGNNNNNGARAHNNADPYAVDRAFVRGALIPPPPSSHSLRACGVPRTRYTARNVSDALDALVHHYLRPFRNESTGEGTAGASVPVVRASLLHCITDANAEADKSKSDCVLWQVRGGTAYLRDVHGIFGDPRSSDAAVRRGEARFQPFFRWTAQLLSAARLPERLEFVQCMDDFVPSTYRTPLYLRLPPCVERVATPVLALISCGSFSHNVPLPVFEAGSGAGLGRWQRGGGANFDDWDQAIARYTADRSGVPWSLKESRAIFRGAMRRSLANSLRNASGVAQLRRGVYGRHALYHAAERAPDALDVSVSGVGFPPIQSLTQDAQMRMRYAIYAAGNCGWAERLYSLLHGPQTIIKEETPCGSFFEPLLRPWVHYVPTAMSFNDTAARVRWLRRHDHDDNDHDHDDDAARDIVANANHFAHAFVSRRGMLQYVEKLLARLAALQRSAPDGAIDVDGAEIDARLAAVPSTDSAEILRLMAAAAAS